MNLSGAEALDLSGWLMKGLRQVSETTSKHFGESIRGFSCARTWAQGPLEHGLSRLAVPQQQRSARAVLGELYGNKFLSAVKYEDVEEYNSDM